MEIKELLRRLELFNRLTEDELDNVARIFQERRLSRGEIVARQGAEGDEFYLVADGFVEVELEAVGQHEKRTVISLGRGQMIGEMALVDRGPRSATVRAVSDPTVLHVARRKDFEALCEQNTRIGYLVMRNIAADLSFKLRHHNLNP